jgi:hypothetical protein
MTLVFSWEPIDRFISEGIEDLLVLHWEEVANDKDFIPYAPDWERYRHMEKMGQFKALGAWRRGKLIGYNAFFTFTPYHYRRTLQAINDIIYIDPEERGEAGIRLILNAERDLFRDGVVKIQYHTKLHVLLGAGSRGGSHDSLDNIEMLMEIWEEFGQEVPDDVSSGDFTLGGLLARLGYRHAEEVWDKVHRP